MFGIWRFVLHTLAAAAVAGACLTASIGQEPLRKEPVTPAAAPTPLARDVISAPSPTASPSERADADVIRVTTDLVMTPVSVVDRQGRFLPNLNKENFQIFENEVAQEIAHFETFEQPFTVVLMIDVSPSTKYKIDEIHRAVLAFVNQLRAADRVMVIAFDRKMHVLTPKPTNDKQEVADAIRKSDFGSGTSLYDAIDYVSELDIVKLPGRKAVVVFTDGVDTTSQNASFESTVAKTQELDALIYPIRYDTASDLMRAGGNGGGPSILEKFAGLLMGGLFKDKKATGAANTTTVSSGTLARYARGKEYLSKLAENTGGNLYDSATLTDLDRSFKEIAEQLRQQYSIGYYPKAEAAPGQRRSVKIKTNVPDAIVRSKSGYVTK